MVYELRSNDLELKINSKGAEICSAIHKGVEYIWQAKPDVWPRHSPILFPIVGRLKDNRYTYQGKIYSLSQHGFARDKEFNCTSREKNTVVFELKQDDETKKNFPFDFVLRVTYEVNERVVKCTYEVSNPSSGELYFGIGAHPGFRTDELNDYTLRFQAKQFEITLLENGLLSEHKEKLHVHTGELPLDTTLFDKDALVFENKQVEVIELISKNGAGVELSCKGWPYFGIWSKKECHEFICLEPWHGITDSVNCTGDIAQKKGIISLEGGKKFECSFSIRFF
jgi:galactose mutarotase-like enzyme